MKAVILCAGKGERLRPLTDKLPKPMIPINNRPILEYIILLCKKHGIKELFIDVSYLSENIKKYFGTGKKFGIKINYPNNEEPIGTSGILNKFKKDLNNEPFFVIYGDNITNLNLTNLKKAHEKNKAFCTIYLYHEQMANKDTTPGCVVLDEKSFVNEIIEHPDSEQKKEINRLPPDRKYTNSGIYLVSQKIFDFIPTGFSDFAKDIFPEVLKKKLKIYGYTEDCYIREVGQMHRYLKAKEEIETGKITF